MSYWRLGEGVTANGTRVYLAAPLFSQAERTRNKCLRDLISNFANGRRVRVDTGVQTYLGTTDGLSPEGLLIVKKDGGGSVAVIAGDISEVK